MLQKIKVPIILQEQVPSDNNAQTDTSATDTSATDTSADTINCSEYESRDDCPVGCKWDMYDVKCKDETPKEKCDRELDMICVSHFDHAMTYFGYVLFALLCLGVALVLLAFSSYWYMSLKQKNTSNSEYFSDVSSVLTSVSQL